MQQLPKFFDWRGELGRIEYFYAVVWRGFIYLCIVAINYGLSALWGWDVAFTEESDWSWIFTDPFVTVAEFVIFVPIVIRRLSDVGISLWWIFAFEALILIPGPPDESEGLTAAYLILVILPYLLWMLAVQLMPGKVYQKWRRERRSNRSGQIESRRSRVTFSE